MLLTQDDVKKGAMVPNPDGMHVWAAEDPSVVRARQFREMCLRMALPLDLSGNEIIARASAYFDFIMNGKTNESSD